MNAESLYLVCFGVGALWSFLSLLGGHFHLGHHHRHYKVGSGEIAVFLAWFGGIGYLLTRHSALGWTVDAAIAVAFGLLGAVLLAMFIRWLQSHEKSLEQVDTGMIGVLGRVSALMRAGGGVGEIIFVREGVRKSVPARAEDENEIQRGEEVVITRYENGIAHVRTWAALTQPVKENHAKGDSL